MSTIPVTDILGSHWLVMDDLMRITGCHCGFVADESDCGYGDGTVRHMLELAWDQGHSADSVPTGGVPAWRAASNPYAVPIRENARPEGTNE